MKPASLLSRIKAWFKAATLRQRFEHDMDEEIRFHLEAHTKTLVDQGVPEAEARRQARIAFGGAESSRDGVRHALGLRPLDELLADLRYAVRVLRNSPGFTLIAAGSLALAIGANTTIFSVAHFMLLERLAVPRATELRVLYEDQQPKHGVFHSFWGSSYPTSNGDIRFNSFTWPVFQQMQREQRALGVEIAAFKEGDANASFDGKAQRVDVEYVSGNFYQVLGTVPALGRAIQATDDGVPGTGQVAVLSYGLWQRAFGGAPDVIGKTVRIDTIPFTIIGVNPKGFTGARSVQRSPQMFLPMSIMATLHGTLGKDQVMRSTTLCWVQMILRKPASVSEDVLRTQLDHNFRTAVLATVTPKAGETMPTLVVADGSRGQESNSRRLRQPIFVLLGLVGCVLLLACANVANLMLARASNRQREISVRLALGAGRSRVFRQMLVESLLLAALGGTAGAFLGYLGREAAPRLLQTSWDTEAVAVPFHWPVFAFTMAVTLVTGVLFGLAPAWQSTRTNVNTALKQGANSATRRRKAWGSKGLVAFQVAMATLLVAGSALFLRTVMNLTHVDPGFQPKDLLLAQVQVSDKQYGGQRSLVLHKALLQRVASVPRVEGVTAAVIPLISNSMWNSGMKIEGEAPRAPAKDGKDDDGPASNLDIVSPDFFSVLQIPILQGRGFNSSDTSTSPGVAVVNQSFVRKFFPGKNPIGARITGDDEEIDGKRIPIWLTVVGVCADTQYSDLRTERGPIYFTDIFQYRDRGENGLSATYIVRSRLAPGALVPSLRDAVHAIDPDLPLVEVRTQNQQIDDVSRSERLFATLTAGFGVLALALACVGIYGIMAYTVSQRTHEIGIRLALGAARGRVRGMVLREATWLAVLGVALGLAAALALAKLVKSLLYGLEPRDPLSLTLTAALLLAVALSAAWLPAARAARLEPVIALRQD